MSAQPNLFDDLPVFNGFKGQDGAHWKAGCGVARNWRGYFRFSESGKGLGAFYITGFSGPEDATGTAHVLMIDEQGETYTEPHAITASGVLMINGHGYARGSWSH